MEIEISKRQPTNSVGSKKSKSAKKKAALGELGRLTPKKLQTLNTRPIWTTRQLYFPSATTMAITGTGASYTAASGLVTTASSATTFWSLYFRLGDLPQVGTIGPLYDQYRIDDIKVHLVPQYTVTTYNGSVAIAAAPIYTAVDYDDSSNLTAITDIFQYDNCQIWNPLRPVLVHLQPRLAIPSGTGFVNENRKWIDMADSSVQHYGIKSVMPTAGQALLFTLVVEAAVSFRSVR